jgi:hypothetical protein
MKFTTIKKVIVLILFSSAALFLITSFRYYAPNELVAIEFINSLSSEQRENIVLEFDNESREEWTFLPVTTTRDGLLIKNLNDEQKNILHKLLKTYLSQDGYRKTKSIIELESILREIENGNRRRDPELYGIVFYGMPGVDEAWGWKFEGHHISLNYTTVSNKLSIAPRFFGANPAEIMEGSKKGFRALENEEDIALKLVNSLSADQRDKAIFRSSAYRDIVTSRESKVTPLEPVGISIQEMNTDQSNLLMDLISEYIFTIPEEIGQERLNKIKQEGLDNILFGWAGETELGKPHYYRVKGKSFLIEFDNTQNSANHIHSVWRDFNGYFGRDLIKEHYNNSDHHK